MEKIINLINNNNFNELNKIIREPLINNNYLIHIATINNKINLIKYLINKDKELIKLVNNDNETYIHLALKYGYYDIIKESIDIYPEILNIIDNNNNTILHILDPNLILYNELIIKYLDLIDFNIINNEKFTIFHHNINNSISKNDLVFKNIKIIIEKIDINYPKINPPIIYTIIKKKRHIIDLLLERKELDINIINNQYINPLIIAVELNDIKTIKKIIEKDNLDINYSGINEDLNPYIIALNNRNYKIIKILIDKIDLNKQDRKLNSLLHHTFEIPNINSDIICKLLFNGNLNLKNINNITPLHLFLKNYNWKNYTKILENVNMDIFIKNKLNKTAISYIYKKDLPQFINILTNSFINNMDNKFCINLKTYQCKYKIKKYIFDNKQSIPQNITNKDLIKFKNIEGQKGINIKFNSDTIHNIIYTIIILSKYKQLGIPNQEYKNYKYIQDKNELYYNNLYILDNQLLITDLYEIYLDFLYEISPHIIIWKSNTEYFIHKNLDFYIKRVLYDKTKMFIYIKLTIIMPTGTHANIIIIDKEKGIIERFEPYGNIKMNNEIDLFLEEKITNMIKKYMNENNIKIEYKRSKMIGYQLIGNDTDINYRVLGDPVGFCLAWSYWYLETRITNKDIEIDELIKQTYNNIIGSNKDNSEKIFTEYIRHYSNKLDKKKNKLLIKFGIEKENIYNLSYTEEEQLKIKKGLSKIFNNIK